MADEEQVQLTQQDVETAQPGDQQLDQPTSETEQSQTTETPAEQSQEGKDPNGWALKRINELTRQRHEAERTAQTKSGEAERYRLLVEQMRNGEQGDQPQVPGQQPNIDEMVNQRAKQIAQQQAMAERGQSVAKIGGEAFPDFQTAVQTLDALGISQDSVESILGMDDAHKVLYTLGKNPEEAARILSLPPLQQGRELERLALKAGQPAPKAVSKAPAPISPVDGSLTVETDPSKMSTDEWMKWRAKNTTTRF
jgi:hypothetical protein